MSANTYKKILFTLIQNYKLLFVCFY